MYLVAAETVELQEEFLAESYPTFGLRVDLYEPATDAIRIELFVPRSVKRVCKIDALPVAAHFHHLWSAVQSCRWVSRMRGAPDNSAEVQRGGELWVKWVGHIVLLEFARAPAGHVEKPIVKREINIRHKRWHSLKSLEEWRKLLRIGRLGRNFDHLLDGPVAIIPVPKPNRSGQILQGNNHADKSVGLCRIVRRA